jgi:poly(A) polymerase/tRNA nucleotidyltransferase (CCA-adding enzyme)
MKTLPALKALQEETKAEVFLVGGFVRDYLRNKKNDDLDVVVRKISSKEIVGFLQGHGQVKEVTLAINNDAFVTELILFKGSGDELIAQIVLPRRGKKQIADRSNTLRQDAKFRDFKINAMYLPINFTSKADLIDSVGGQKEIQERVISCVSDVDDCLSMSPIRILRAISLAARTGYRLDADLFSGMKTHASKLKDVIPEAIRRELNKILLSKKPSKHLRLMQRLGILKYVIPELARCVGVTQDTKYHKFDVFTHCIYTCDNTEPDLVLRLAGLLHDVGKADAKKVIGKRITFHKHEMFSVRHAKTFLNRLRYDGKTKAAVLTLVRMHMYHYTREYSDAAVRRFIKKVDITEDMLDNLGNLPLFKLRQAERLGNGLKSDPVTQRQLDFEERIRRIVNAGGSMSMKELDIDGRILIDAFGLTSGKLVGELKNYLLDRVQQDRTLNERLKLIELALEYIKEHS